MHRLGILSVLIVVAIAALIGGCASGAAHRDIATSSQGRGTGTTVKGIHFEAATGVGSKRILRVAGLTLLASCRHIHGNSNPLLSVSAQTSVDNAVLATHFGQQRRGFADYTFVDDDFDHGSGERRDVLGTNPDKTAGTLDYSRPDGREVSVTFVADEGTAQAACLVGGTAVSARR